ncbi:hypothetical protein Bca52824_063577 [Brassica carinata]|uniref:Uncharacterized protein n=1 Tax=Brassica carinata TaxID=52824 RepID=A0A8X7QGP1_BRACI|nr:hypothetical protein Bca52824_063577 [Brassica carinata]
MSESPQPSQTGSNSHCKSDQEPFPAPPSLVQSTDPLLFVPDREPSPTLTLPAEFKIPESISILSRVELKEQTTPPEPTETPPRRQTNLECFNEHLNIFGKTPVTHVYVSPILLCFTKNKLLTRLLSD